MIRPLSIELPASKSIHNRAVILKRLYYPNLTLINPSNSADSVLMEKLIQSSDTELFCDNAGTVIRFLTSYFGCKEGITKILTGSERMKSRPIGELVDVLTQLGAEIHYLEKPGFPPIQIHGKKLEGGRVYLSGDISSQFITSLLLIAPSLQNGLTIEITGQTASEPYIRLTVSLMKSFGFIIDYNQNIIKVKQGFEAIPDQALEIEPDWSAVAFWLQIIAFSCNGSVHLNKLKKHSLQGDAILQDWIGMLGLKYTFTETGLLLKKSDLPVLNNTTWDLNNYPDLAPSLIVLLSALKRNAEFTGLQTLKTKESDRTKALSTELKKCNVDFTQVKERWILDASNFNLNENTEFESYHDHRIAMAFGALNVLRPVIIKDPECVEKSYPGFWDDLNNFMLQNTRIKKKTF